MTEPTPRPVALMFPGQGSQHVRMGAGLYGADAVFTETMDKAFSLWGRDGERLRDDWLGRTGLSQEDFDDVSRAQPLLYAVGYALGRAALEMVPEPVALIGHSVGEMVAASLAGVIDLPDGMALMRDRVEALRGSAPGTMLAVAASVEEITPHLRGDVVVGAVNAPRQTLVAGPEREVERVREDLHAAGFTCRSARSRQAFHSPALTPFVRGSAAVWTAVELRAPRLPVYSARLGAPLDAASARDPWFWAAQPAEPVLFWPALDRLLADQDVLLLEAGPGQGLSTIARRHRAVVEGRSAVVPLLPARPGKAAGDIGTFTAAALRLWEEGHAPPAGGVAGAGAVHLPAHAD